MDFFEFILSNWAVITAFLGVVLGYFAKWAEIKITLKLKVGQLADVFDELRDAIADDNVGVDETIKILNKARLLIGVANYDQILSTLRITRER